MRVRAGARICLFGHTHLPTVFAARGDDEPAPPTADGELQLPARSKVLINACKPHRYLKQFPPATLLRREIYERVAARWAELGFADAPPKLDVFWDRSQ